MSHAQQTAWVKGLIGDTHPQNRFSHKAILELGSYDVNGSVRDLFYSPLEPSLPPSRYVGVDWRAGPRVDHISLFHEIPWIEEFDVLVSCNAFEHDPYWEKSIAAGLRALKPGGEIMLCCAGPGYPPHAVDSSPLPQHYCNLGALQFLSVIVGHGGRGSLIEFAEPPDLAFFGNKL